MEKETIKVGGHGSKKRFFDIGVKALQENGYTIERIPGIGKSSVRRITKDGQSKVASIKTTQDTWISFQRNDTSWVTLPDVEVVVAVSIGQDPQFVQVHMIDGKDMLERFNQAYAARLAAGNTTSPGSGFWVPLYENDLANPVFDVGAGAGLTNPWFFRTPLNPEKSGPIIKPTGEVLVNMEPTSTPPFTIMEAKQRLAIAFGVHPSNIKITIEA